MRLGVFKVSSLEAASDMLLGTALAAMRTVLQGRVGPDYPEIVVQHTLGALGVPPLRAARIAYAPLPELPDDLAQIASVTARGTAEPGVRQPSAHAAPADDHHP